MEAVCLSAAVLLTTYVVLGVLLGRSYTSWREQLHSATAWCAVVGGGAYGLGLFDSRLLPEFNWWYMGIVICGALVLVIIKLIRRK
jgi:hypothetical protein